MSRLAFSAGVIALASWLALVTPAAQTPAAPSLEAVLQRVGNYVESYGEKAALVVSIEKYTQSVALEGVENMPKPRQLVAEFALVKTGDGSWIGFRDVVEMDGRAIGDRRDRLLSLMTGASADQSELTRIANESARFNVGPVIRNFNVPTTTLMLFTTANLPRFAFTNKGAKTIDGQKTWELAFKEVHKPTFVMTRGGIDVPVEGSLWVIPEDGTVVRTRLKMRNFADRAAPPEQTAPKDRPAPVTTGPVGSRSFTIPDVEWQPIKSSADTEVTYRKDPAIGLWLPTEMSEYYSGPIQGSRSVIEGRANTRATYADFKQFGTVATIKQ